MGVNRVRDSAPLLALSLILALALALCLCRQAGAHAFIEVPILGQESVAPKWMFDGPRPQGMCADILAAIERTDPALRFTGYDRPRSLVFIEDAMARGSAWAACALVDSPMRHKIAVRASVPLYQARYRLATVAGDHAQIRSLDELARLKPLVNTQRGSGYIADLKRRGIEIDDSTGDSLINLRKTLHGHGRYTYLAESSMLYYIRMGALEDQLTVLPTVFNNGSLYFWTSKKADPALAPAIELALVKLKANGELARIYQRWTTR